MNTLSIVLIIAAAIIGAIIAFFVAKANFGNHEVEDAESSFGTQRELVKQKEKAEKKLAEAQERISSLDAQLKAALSNGSVGPNLVTNLADTDKLKKKIKTLENELADAEDDLEDTEKKLKKKSSEFSELQQKKNKLESDYEKRVKEIEQIRSELSQKKEELELKMESLEFVQSILSAQEVNNSSTNELYEKINDVSNFYVDEILGFLEQLELDCFDKEKVVEKKEHVKKWAITQKKNWIAGKTAIAFVGEFSAGKTSIVNRILSQDNPDVHLLPVSTKATTAIPTYISGGIRTDYHFFTHDNRLKYIKEEDFNRVTKEVLDQVNGVSNLIKYFVMTYKNANLNNLSILDTPGFNSNDMEDSERTLEVINECDALFWVFDVNAGTVNKTSIDLIKENLKKPLYVVINKVDTKSQSEVDKVERLIKETFAREKVTVNAYIRFSSKEPLESIMTPILQVERTDDTSNFIMIAKEEVEDVLKKEQDLTRVRKKEFDERQRMANNCVNKFINALQLLYKNCDDAASIPQYNSRFFGKDDYRMSQQEYDHLIHLLNTIVGERTDQIATLFDEQQENQQYLQSTYTYWKETEHRTKQIQDLLSRWEKLIKQLNQHINN